MTSIDTVSNALMVLGQKVLITASTSFDKRIAPTTLAGLAVGTIIEVSGLANATGVVTATRIGLASSNEALQVRGKVTALNTSTHLLTINGLNVDFAAASLSGFTNGQPVNGNYVVVRGTTFNATTITLTAAVLQLASSTSENATVGERTELEGLVTRFASATDIDVNGSPAITTPTTAYKGGTVSDLVLNARVEVAGTLNASKILVADTVAIEHIAVVAIESPVTAINPTAGTLTVLGVNVAVNAYTRF